MPEYRAPGVYVEEVDRGPKPIEGVSTSTAGFLGETERGPTDPELVTSFADFERKYGGFALYRGRERLAGTYLAYAVDGFFRNGGTRCYVGRVTPEEMPTATADLRANEPGSPTPRVDFGTVPVDGTSTKTLTFANVTGNVVTIDTTNTGVTSGQDNFGAGAPTATRLESGTSTTLEVTYTADSTDVHTGELTVTFGSPETNGSQDDLVVELIGEGGEALATAAKILEFGSRVVTESTVKRVTLTNLADDPVTIDTAGITVLDDTDTVVEAFEVSVDAESLGPEGTTRLTVRFSPTTVGVPDATVSVPYTVDDTDGTLELDVTGSGGPALVASTQWVDFGTVDAQDTPTDPVKITLTNRSNAEVTIDTDGIEILDEADNEATEFDATDPDPATLGAGDETTMEVTFTAPDENRFEATLTVPYTYDGAPEQELTVSVVGQGPTDLAADRLRVDFGSVPFSQRSSPEPIRVTNQSGEQVTIDTDLVATDDSDDPVEAFEVGSPAQDTLANGDETTIEVMFHATSTGRQTATLSIPYTVGGSDETFDVALVADGGAAFDVSTSVTFGSIEAVGPGVWGTHVAAFVEAGSLHKQDNPLFKLTIRYWSYDADVEFVKEHGADHDDVPDPDVEEVYDNLSLDEASSNYFEKQIDDVSTLVEVEREGSAVPSKWDVEPVWLSESFPSPTPAVSVGDYRGESTPGARTGFAAFEEVDDISIVCVPDEASDREEHRGLTQEIVAHCTDLKDRFAVLQTPEKAGDIENLEPRIDSTRLDSKYAGYYFPWIKIRDPETNVEKLVPPGGHVAGIYARNDTERGVHKAPANEVVRGTHELQLNVTKEEQAILNPKGVNCIRNFPGRGIRVWGARTTSTDPSWKYVNVRRLFLYLEESIDEGTQWVVFEPNDEKLWARVRQTVSNFLTTVWRDGALMGTTPEEAFYVRCDRTTMTQADIDNGRLIVEIGVAPVKPAEFVIFRISQWTGGAEGA